MKPVVPLICLLASICVASCGPDAVPSPEVHKKEVSAPQLKGELEKRADAHHDFGTTLESEERTDLPEFSIEKPVAGLEMKVNPVNKQFKVGDFVSHSCTITNVSSETKPIAWDPQLDNFWQQSGEKMIPGGIGRRHFLTIDDTLVIRSTPGLHRGYTLYLPPKAQLTFSIHIGKARAPETFRGRYFYDPLPQWGGGPFGIGLKPEERWLISNLFEYEIVP